MASEGK